MRLPDVIDRIIDGDGCRRASWPEGWWVRIERNLSRAELMLYGRGSKAIRPLSLDASDLLADDWELCPEGVSFGRMLEMLREGRRCRRASWPDGKHLALDPLGTHDVAFVSISAHAYDEYMAPSADMFADDWVVYDARDDLGRVHVPLRMRELRAVREDVPGRLRAVRRPLPGAQAQDTRKRMRRAEMRMAQEAEGMMRPECDFCNLPIEGFMRPGTWFRIKLKDMSTGHREGVYDVCSGCLDEMFAVPDGNSQARRKDEKEERE